MTDETGQRVTLMHWLRLRGFLRDLNDPEVYGFAVSQEVRRRARELLAPFEGKPDVIP